MRNKRIKQGHMEPPGLLARKMIRLWGKKGFKGGWDLPERLGLGRTRTQRRVIVFWWFGDQADSGEGHVDTST